MAMTTHIEILKPAATTGPVVGKNPVEILLAKLDQQASYPGDLIAASLVSGRSLWFRRDGAGRIVRIGRNAFDIAGSKLFRAADLEKVIEILNATKAAIQTDKKLQDTIALHSLKRSKQLKAGRTKGKAKQAAASVSAN